VFASVPGETHTLGISMAAELFRRKGWEIELKLGLPHEDLVEALTASRTRVVGLSAGGGHALPALARLVVAVRAAMPGALILIGGKAVELESERVRLLGADAVTSDVTVATRKLKLLADIADPDDFDDHD
jgi:methanogenic corrinoid protein MtbC1